MFFGQSRVPDGTRIFAIGDIHGFSRQLTRLLAAIDRDLSEHPPAHHRIITLGDYCDRGPDTPGVIDTLIARQAADPAMMCLKGNHDALMFAMLSEPHDAAPSWLAWGGMQTLASYGINTRRPERDPDGVSRRLGNALPPDHRAFLQDLLPMHVEGDYCFVHAGLMPDIALEDQALEDLMWIRAPFLDHTGSFGKVVVHGHTIHDRPTILPNRIAVDTGVYASGLLSCAVLEADRCRFIVADADEIIHSAPMF